jgi:hypothetical protein
MHALLDSQWFDPERRRLLAMVLGTASHAGMSALTGFKPIADTRVVIIDGWVLLAEDLKKAAAHAD